jgi:predicted DNA-binding ribbon-helix-helix protein
MTNYKMLRIKQATYKELKQIALNQDCTLICLIEELLVLKQKADSKVTNISGDK